MSKESALPTRPSARKAVISLPGLSCALPLGGGCCATAMDDAVLDELTSWPSILSAGVDVAAETATVTTDPGRPDQLEHAVEALRDLGLPEARILEA